MQRSVSCAQQHSTALGPQGCSWRLGVFLLPAAPGRHLHSAFLQVSCPHLFFWYLQQNTDLFVNPSSLEHGLQGTVLLSLLGQLESAWKLHEAGEHGKDLYCYFVSSKPSY